MGAIEESVQTILSAIQSLRGDYDDLMAKVEAQRELLSKLESSRNVIERELAQHRVNTSNEKAALDKMIASLQVELKKLQEELQELVGKKSTLMADNMRLTHENEEFKRYEKKAWAALNSKDQELQSREKGLTEKEVVIANRSSYLPAK